jgi:hypothetical protein
MDSAHPAHAPRRRLSPRECSSGPRKRPDREAVELFTTREGAETIVRVWDRDDPEQAGALRVEKLEVHTGTAN